MKKILVSGIAALTLVALGALTTPVRADAPPSYASVPDATVGTARISLVSGSVAVQHADATANTAAAVNAPLLAGDALTTGAASQAEIQFDGASIVRLDGNTQARFSNIDPDAAVVQLAQGTLSVDLLQGSTVRPEVDTPSISILPDDVGSYRVTVTADGKTLLTVRDGTADVTTPQGTQTVGVGSTLVAQGPAADPSITTRDAVAVDAFDAFNTQRDGELSAALASSDAYGDYDGQDLGQYGNWVDDPTYGDIWVPDDQSAGWAPYRDGEWVYEDAYYGYTWVSYEPWGWAPYHYGRWAYVGGRWGWCPPRGRQAWSPALVAFFGFGSDVGLSIGFGNVGWVPLGPSDPFRPWWGSGRSGRVAYDATAIVNFGNYRHGGASSVGARSWQQGDFRHNQAVSPSVRASVAFSGRGPLAPTASNLRESQRALPASLSDRHFDSAAFAGSSRGTQQRFAAPVARTNVVRSSGSDPWTRFSQSRGNDATAGYGRQVRVQQQAQFQQRTGSDPWARFDDQRAAQQSERTYRQQQPTYRYQQSQQQRSYQQTQRTYQQPQRTYQQSERSSSPPQRSSNSGSQGGRGHSH